MGFNWKNATAGLLATGAQLAGNEANRLQKLEANKIVQDQEARAEKAKILREQSLKVMGYTEKGMPVTRGEYDQMAPEDRPGILYKGGVERDKGDGNTEVTAAEYSKMSPEERKVYDQFKGRSWINRKADKPAKKNELKEVTGQLKVLESQGRPTSMSALAAGVEESDAYLEYTAQVEADNTGSKINPFDNKDEKPLDPVQWAEKYAPQAYAAAKYGEHLVAKIIPQTKTGNKQADKPKAVKREQRSLSPAGVTSAVKAFKGKSAKEKKAMLKSAKENFTPEVYKEIKAKVSGDKKKSRKAKKSKGVRMPDMLLNKDPQAPYGRDASGRPLPPGLTKTRPKRDLQKTAYNPKPDLKGSFLRKRAY